MKKALGVLLIFVFLFPVIAFSYNEPEGYGNYRWGQDFSEFKNMSELHKPENDKNMAGAYARGVPKTWKKLKLTGSPLFFFNQLRFEGFWAQGFPGRSEWEMWCLILETELGAPTWGSAGSNEMKWEGQYTS